MRICRLNDLALGEIGLVELGERSLCFKLGPAGPDTRTLVLSATSVRPSARTEIFTLTLSPSEAQTWPLTLAFDDGELSPDLSSLKQSFELPERALVPWSDGTLRVAVRPNGWSIALLDPAEGDLIDPDQIGSFWFFSRWAVTVPSPCNSAHRQSIFDVEIA